MDLDLLADRLRSKYPLPEGPLQPETEKSSAVLVMLYSRHRQPHVLLIQRSDDLRLHPGQISFPGGTPEEPKDGSSSDHGTSRNQRGAGSGYTGIPGIGPVATLLKPLTGYVAYRPFITILDRLPCIPCTILMRSKKYWKFRSCPCSPPTTRKWVILSKKQMVAYWHLEHRVWGATAKILNQIQKAGFGALNTTFPGKSNSIETWPAKNPSAVGRLFTITTCRDLYY